jgi:hypothetical protein
MIDWAYATGIVVPGDRATEYRFPGSANSPSQVFNGCRGLRIMRPQSVADEGRGSFHRVQTMRRHRAAWFVHNKTEEKTCTKSSMSSFRQTPQTR